MFQSYLAFFTRPAQIVRGFRKEALRPDLIAGLTVAVVLLPQAIAYAFITQVPPQVGLYTAIVAAIVGGLWGSSNQLHTGPTSTGSLLIFSALLAVAEPGSAMASKAENISSEPVLVGPVCSWFDDPHSAPTMDATMAVYEPTWGGTWAMVA